MDMTIEEMASLGGKARAKKLSPERRHEIAVNAGKATKAKFSSDYYKNIRKGISPSKILQGIDN